MRCLHSRSACENLPGAYASRAKMANLAIIGLLLMTTSVRGMPDGVEDSNRSSWANDIRGIDAPYKPVDREVQPNIIGLSLVERVPKTLRILYIIKLSFLYRLMKQINKSLVYEKIKFHTYYLLETDFPALQGAHTTACSVPMHHMARVPILASNS